MAETGWCDKAHLSHYLFLLLPIAFFLTWWIDYISKNRLYSLISTKKQQPPLRSPSELSCFYWENIKSLMLFWRSSNYVFCMRMYCTFICTLTVDLFWISVLLILWFSCVEINIFAKTTNLKCMYILNFCLYLIFIQHLHMYTTIQKFGFGWIFKCFWKKSLYAHQGCIYLVKNTVKSCEISYKLYTHTHIYINVI